MTAPNQESRPRILIVDDNPAIHDDFRKILGAKSDTQTQLEDVEVALFGQTTTLQDRAGFRIDSAYQGREALTLVQQALDENDPYVLAFVDVRMPPGWDGVETLERIWQCAPELQAVICTAYSDYSWDDMTQRLGHADNLLILKKPFETVEVLQLAHALTKKWALGRQARLRMEDLDRMVRERTEELVTANTRLQREIEERVRAQDELRVSQERFSKAFHCSPNPMALISADSRRFLDFNQSFIDLSACSASELSEQSDAQLQLWSRTAEGRTGPFVPAGRLRDLSCVLRRRDGTDRQVILSAEPLSLGNTPCVLLIVQDISDQLKLESQLRQAQKMEVIGRMAAGIAHEFNNVLTVIQGDVGLLQANSPSLDRSALLHQIMQASQRAASFTKQLLAFSRKQVLQPRFLNLSMTVQNTRKMLSRLIGEKYEIRLSCSNDLPTVRADEGGMEQILINLALNARDAMPDGGLMEIATELVEITEPDVRTNPEARAGRFICLRIMDQGCGMSPEVIARIFDPFFTTKDVGKGTGLGLSTIHGIVKQHEGWVEVVSALGEGATFRIYLPACESAPQAAAGNGVIDQPPLASGRGELVLVVEDEMAVRELACAALEKRGYRVIKAANGPEAIQVWERHSRDITLLLTDMVMPGGMSGGELARSLQSRDPALKVIYTSGYSPEILRKDSLLANGINFLPKPYDLQTLLKTVRVCLDSGNSRISDPSDRPKPAAETALV